MFVFLLDGAEKLFVFLVGIFVVVGLDLNAYGKFVVRNPVGGGVFMFVVVII